MKSDEQIRLEAAQHVTSLGIHSGAARQIAIATRVEQLRAENQTEQDRHDAEAEAAAERQRISAIVRLGRDQGRERQALRVALLGPVSASQAGGILPSLAADQDTQDADKAVPGFVPFPGESAAVAGERRRIRSIFAHPAAAGRFKTAVAIALDGDGEMPPEAAAALLAALPVEPEKPRTPSIEERQAGMAEFGPADPVESRQEAVAAGWKRAAQRANAELGIVVTSARPAQPVADLPGAASVAAHLAGRS